MSRSVAINVGANTNTPGFRGPIYPDGAFEYVPIPETEATARRVPTYDELDLQIDVPPDVRETPVHLDPEFAGYPHCQAYTYGDPHGVKARPLLDLGAGDYVFFYATLTAIGEPERDWIAPDWGAYVIGQFRLASDPLDSAAYEASPAATRDRFANNAHCKREEFDAAVLVAGDDTSRLYETAVPLSGPEDGTTPNSLVTDHSSDSGKGPWWRRPLRFDADGTTAVRSVADGDRDRTSL